MKFILGVASSFIGITIAYCILRKHGFGVWEVFWLFILIEFACTRWYLPFFKDK